MNKANGYKAQGKAMPVMGIDSVVLRDATDKQRKAAKMSGKGHDSKSRVYGFILKGFFKA